MLPHFAEEEAEDPLEGGRHVTKATRQRPWPSWALWDMSITKPRWHLWVAWALQGPAGGTVLATTDGPTQTRVAQAHVPQ